LRIGTKHFQTRIALLVRLAKELQGAIAGKRVRRGHIDGPIILRGVAEDPLQRPLPVTCLAAARERTMDFRLCRVRAFGAIDQRQSSLAPCAGASTPLCQAVSTLVAGIQIHRREQIMLARRQVFAVHQELAGNADGELSGGVEVYGAQQFGSGFGAASNERQKDLIVAMHQSE
jgi:hypothetical protein